MLICLQFISAVIDRPSLDAEVNFWVRGGMRSNNRAVSKQLESQVWPFIIYLPLVVLLVLLVGYSVLLLAYSVVLDGRLGLQHVIHIHVQTALTMRKQGYTDITSLMGVC